MREEGLVVRRLVDMPVAHGRSIEDLSDTFQPVARATLQEGIYDQVCAALMDGRLRPGQRISLRSLSAAMNTSPMPVREALRRLEAGHVLELRAGGMLAVPHPSREELLEIRDIRMSLEGLAAERAAARMTRKELERVACLGRRRCGGKPPRATTSRPSWRPTANFTSRSTRRRAARSCSA